MVEATADWDKGYRFEIAKIGDFGDFGHISPARYIKSFSRNSEHASGNIRATLRNPSRFWSISHFADDVETLRKADKDELANQQDHDTRMQANIASVWADCFDSKKFQDELYTKFCNQFSHESWEFVLVNGLKAMLPFYEVERVGGKTEVYHGTDILIKLPSILPDYQYAIAIQVKDYKGQVNKDVFDQLNKADEYWGQENLKLIEKWLIITEAKKEVNLPLAESRGDIRILFAEEMKQLLDRMARHSINLTEE